MYLYIYKKFYHKHPQNSPPHLNNVAGFLENLTLKRIEQQKYIMYLYVHTWWKY